MCGRSRNLTLSAEHDLAYDVITWRPVMASTWNFEFVWNLLSWASFKFHDDPPCFTWVILEKMGWTPTLYGRGLCFVFKIWRTTSFISQNFINPMLQFGIPVYSTRGHPARPAASLVSHSDSDFMSFLANPFYSEINWSKTFVSGFN